MTAYGDTNTVATMLEPSSAGFSDALLAQIDAEREAVSRLIDEKTGRTFGAAGISETRTIRKAGVIAVLPVPARSISAVRVNMTDEGGVVSGGTLLTASDWRVELTDADGNIAAIRFWSSPWT